MKLFSFFIFCAFTIFAVESNFKSAEVFPLNLNLTSSLAWMETSVPLTLDEVLSSKYEEKFLINNKDTLNLGFQKGYLWIKIPIHIKKNEEKKHLEFRYRQFEKIELYFVHKETKTVYESVVNIDSFIERILFRNHFYSFPKIQEEGDFEIYAKAQFYMPIHSEVWLLNEVNFLEKKQNIHFSMGLFYGILIVVIFYSLTLFYTTKNLGLLYYIFFLLTLGLTDSYTSGTINVMFKGFPDFINILKKTISSITELFCLSMIKEIVYDTHKNRFSKQIFSFLVGLSLLHFLVSLSVSIETATRLMFVFGIIIGSGLLFTLIYNLFLKDLNSIWILSSLSVLILTSLVNFFVGYGFFSHSWFISDSIKISAIAQVFIFSFFLSYRIDQNRKQLKQMNSDLELRVNHRTQELSETLRKLEERDVELQRELNLSVELLKSLSPMKQSIYSLVDFRVFQESFLQIGGDFFDIIQRPDGSICIFIADASGHGISAALLVALYKITFRNVLMRENLKDPEIALSEINDQATATLLSHNYLTVFLLILEANGKLRYSSAGHRPAFLFRTKKDKAEILSTRGMLLGISRDRAKFEQKETKLEIGDKILLYTDGMTEILNSEDKILGSNGLYHIFLKTHRSTLDASFSSFLQEWRRVKGDEPTKDDSSFLFVEFHGKVYK